MASYEAPIVEEVQGGDEVLSITIGDSGWSIVASMNSERVEVKITGRPPFVMSIPYESEADAVAIEMRSLGQDADLCDAIRALASMAGVP
jgi:hypothetical protein